MTDRNELYQQLLRKRNLAAPAEPSIAPRGGGDAPVSYAQWRLWLLDQLEPGSSAYHMPVALRLRGALDAGALRRSLDEVVARHEALRTVFRAGDGGEPVQVVLPAAPLPLARADLAALGPAAREAELRRRSAAEVARPFDLKTGPLLRATLLRLDHEDHALLLTLHHIVSDGWSMDVLVRELTALYAGFATGHPVALPPLPIQYADFAVWQRARLRADALERQRGYWRGRLAGAAPLELPAAEPRGTGARPGAWVSCELPPETSEALHALARAEGASLFMVLLAAFKLLLARWAGAVDVTVGSPIAGRTRKELEGLIGFFLNTLALRTDLAGDPTFRELLARVRETTLGAYEHQELPFEEVMEVLGVGRGTPLFRVFFNMLNTRAATARARLPGLELEAMDPGGATARFDLTLYAQDAGGAVGFDLLYDAELFEAARMEELMAHLREVAGAVASDPELRVSAVPLTPAWSPEAPPRPPLPATDHQSPATLFQEQARLHAGHTALRWEGGAWTYAELAGHADAVARALAARGAHEERVALLFSPGPWMVAAMLGALAAGKTYVPLDPHLPEERLRAILDDSEAAAILAGAEHAGAARGLAGGAAVVEAESLGDGGADPLPTIPGERAAYILYTSGSTGSPKGVVQTHRNLLHHARVYAGALGIGPADRVSLLPSYAFDAAVMDVFGALLSGATLALVDVRAALPRLDRWVRDEGITLLHATPTLFRHLAATAGERFSTVRAVVLGGEEARRGDWEAFRAHFPADAVLVNGLGPTESTLALQHFLRAGSEPPPASLPVGWPVEGTEVALLTPAGEQRAVYGMGEIVLTGEHLAAGYWNRPGETAAAFARDAAGRRSYRTGDMGRRLPDGRVAFAGRRDLQVKVRGFRVEAAEVEAALLSHPGVREAATAPRGEGDERRLVAWVVPADAAAPPSAASLREHLRARLPEYMVPGALVAVDAFPLTSTGKVDRARLPEPERAAEAGYVPPRSPAEEVVAGIFAEILGAERVGAEDDFFALGGHSLTATRVVSRLRESLKVELPLRAVFEAPTVSALAACAVREGDASPSVPLRRVPRDGPVPLSAAQRRFWLLHQIDPASAAYNLPIALRLTGPLRVGALAEALDALVARHEALRTVFGRTDAGEPVQVVLPAAPVRPARVDLSALPPAAREAEVRRLATLSARRPFDLERGPLFRATLLRLDRDEHVALLCLHHAVSDGWSMGVLVREISALYPALAAGREPSLPDLPIQYADYALWQRERLDGEVLERSLGYWRKRLTGVPVLELPTDRPRPPLPSGAGSTLAFRLPPEIASGVRALARREGATPFMVLLAAFQLLLTRYTGQEDVAVGTPVAGRTRAELEGVVGPFLNTLVLRTDLSGEPTFAELVGRAREVTLAAYEHQELPFERLVEELSPDRSLGRTPLFQVLFALQNTERGSLDLGPVRVEAVGAQTGASRWELSLWMAEQEDGSVGGTLEYASELFDASTVERLAGHLEALVERVVAEPDRRVGEVELLAGAERERVLGEWTATAAHYAGEATLAERFAAQAARTPEAEAVVHGGERVTYADLARRAGEVARRLRARGVGAEARVGVLVERGAEMVAALLGVLEAGAAYVPLDPAYPAERLGYMLADSGARVLVTQRALADRLPGAELLLLDEEDAGGELDAANAVGAPMPDGGALAYVIYTSGSTGRPKGVMNTHAGVLDALDTVDERLGGGGGVWLALASLSFDISVLEIFLPLLRGGRVVIATGEEARDGAALAALMEREGVTHAQATPSGWRVLLEGGWTGRPGLRALTGGEALPPDLAEALRRNGVELWNVYGPTETTIWATAARVEGPRVVIGTPLANTRAYVLDARLRLLPVGVPGELCVGGAGVARGYLGRPALTAERFVPDPFAGEPGARMYRTGDRVRWLPTGELEYGGRLDEQVKVRGHRIEPGEVEAALLAQDGVGQAVVVARGEEGRRRLVGYVVAAEGAAPDVETLREGLRKRLPEYMVPDALMVLERLPRTPSGKTDRRALPEPERVSAREHVAPRTPAEEVLAGIFAEVLGAPRVGALDSFFELGGDSIQSIQVVTRARQRGVRVTPRQVFEHPTVAGLAAVAVAEDADAPSATAASQPGPGPIEATYPLAPVQEEMLVHTLEAPRSGAHVVQSRFQVAGALDVPAFERAWREVLARHAALRTAFAWYDGEPRQEVHREVPLPLEHDDWRALGEDERSARAAEYLAEDRARGLDPARAPLLRLRLVRTGERAHELFWTYHHLVLDGWSLPLVFRDLAAFYHAFTRGEAVALAPVRPYGAYAEWLRGRDPAATEGFWREVLHGAAPTLLEAGAGGGEGFATSEVRLPPARTAEVRAWAQRQGLTLGTLVQGAWALLLARYTGADDVMFGTVVSGRPAELEGVEEMVGVFINTLPLRVRVAPGDRGAEWLRGVQSLSTAMREHEHTPRVQMHRWSGLPPATPLFESLVVFENYPDAAALGADEVGVRVTKVEGVENHAYPFMLVAAPGDELLLRLTYDCARLAGPAAERLLGHLAALVEGLAGDPARPLASIPMLGAPERAALARQGRNPVRHPRAPATLHARFEAQAALTPHAPALLHGGETVTFADLNARANRIAHHLRARGVTAEARVGVCLERSPEAVAALLGVLKAGGGYVPLDPAYPAARLGFIVRDAAVSHVVTREGLLDRLPEDAGAEPVLLDREGEAVAACPAEDPRGGAASPDALLYVTYTSGSTGTPKGVMATHAAALNRLEWLWRAYPSAPGEVWCQKTALNFVDSNLEIFGALLRGDPLAIVPDAEARDPRLLADALAAHGCTRLVLVPSLLRALLEEAGLAARIPRLRLWITSGEALPAGLRDRFRQVLPGARLVNLYGTSEVIDATWHEVEEEDGAGPVAIGRPIDNVSAALLDAWGDPVPPGASGELCIGGAGVARGYLGRPGLTAERFVPDPFAAGPGARMYRTGDRARWTEDGRLEYLGRMDHEVKIRGHRIAPAEVEAALVRRPGVRQAVVAARPDAAGGTQLVAYLVPGEAGEAARAAMPFSLFYFAADERDAEGDRYRLYLEGARFADRSGFTAVWTPERHFHEVAGSYPNPSVLSAALAIATQRVKLRAGSVVLPLHDPLRVAEEWAVVDNLSGGRVELAFTSGWVPQDFVLAPDRYARKREVMYEGIETLRALWRGEGVERVDGVGRTVRVKTFPRPVQPELPVWITCSGGADQFRRAGEMGAHVLTGLLTQTLDEAEGNLRVYREARAAHGHDPAAGRVAMMLHTFVGADEDEVLREVREPFVRYMKAHVSLVKTYAGVTEVELESPEALDQAARYAFERYYRTASLIGTPEKCMATVRRLRAMGVDEVASLIDFGLATDTVLDGLESLAALRDLTARADPPDPAALRDALAAELPEPMLPSAFVFMDELPLTPNGKIDRRALPDPERAERPEAAFAAPRSDVETSIAGIWAEVLRAPRVGVHDRFFELGGHSLLAMRVAARVRERFGVEVPLRAVFDEPTVAGMAAWVERALREGGAAAAAPIARVPRGGELPASFAQQRLWFLHRLDPASAAYNVPAALRLEGELDVGALRRALDEVVRRHEPLRTVLRETPAGDVVQVIRDAAPVPFPLVELDGLAPEPRERELRARVAAEAGRPFRLGSEAPLRAVLLRTGPAEHVVIFTAHHVVSDAWSTGVLVREVSALYRAAVSGGGAALPELPVQYADFAAWQRAEMTGGAMERELEYWRGRLAGAPALELPTDGAASAADARGGSVPLRLPAEVASGVRALARREGATPFMVLLAAFQLLLSRYGGQDDVSVGTPVAGRPRPELEGLIGFFSNTLVLRTDLSGDPTFAGLVARARETTLGAEAHAGLPFDRVVEEVGGARGEAHGLFRVAFAVEPATDEGLELPGLAVRGVPAASGASKFDLTARLVEGGDGIEGVLEFRTGLFHPATAERMARHFGALVGHAVRRPDAPLSALEWMDDDERRRVVLDENATAVAIPSLPVHRLFEEQAAATPDAVAVLWEGERVTYAELNARANRLARRLRAAGVRPDQPVAVALERSAGLVVALLAVLKAGGAYLALDAQYPAERLAWMRRDAGASLVIVAGEAPAALVEEGVTVVSLAAEDEALDAHDLDDAAIHPERLAYVVYTSGSTGTPKGVAVPHRAVVRLVRGQEYACFGPGETFLQLAPPAFDASTFEVWGALLNGAALAVFPPRVPAPGELGAFVRERGVTTLWLTAGLFHSVVEEGVEELRGVRQLLAGGDVLSVPHLRRALEALPGTRLINGYGPTETTTFACCHPIGPGDTERRSIPIGRPIANTTAYVVDEALRPVPVGVPGELCVGGAGVARGYAGRPGLTTGRFVPDPFAAEPGARMYRTGDRVRRLDDGAIEFLGRRDEQVKVRGFRVEPGEVAAALRTHPAVGDAVVVALGDGAGDRRLVGYVAAPPGTEGAALRAYLRDRLPAYMLPGEVVVLDALPLTPNGKVDHAALPEPASVREGEYVAPRTPAEELLASLWAELLGVERVGVRDDFFALGGHSLMAMRVAARVRATFGVEVPLAALFEEPTVERLARALEAELPEDGPSDEELAELAELSDEEVARLLAEG